MSAIAGLRVQPCLIVAHPDLTYVARISEAFRHRDWDVYPARSGSEVHYLTQLLEAQLVVLDVDLPSESGWVTCAKLTQELPQLKVILVSRYPAPRDLLRFAVFVGAAGLCSCREGADPLIRLAGTLLPTAR